VRGDHYVPFMAPSSIKMAAEKLREFFHVAHDSNFNIVQCFRRLAEADVFGWGVLEIKFFHKTDVDKPAYVDIGNHRVLYVDYDIWREAELGDPKARNILAHELGHLVLHNHYAQPFSEGKDKRIPDENSAEWQAHKFAEYFLLLDRDLQEYVSQRWIAIWCLVDEEIVRRRFRRQLSQIADFCDRCGGAIFRAGLRTRCDICGSLEEIGPDAICSRRRSRIGLYVDAVFHLPLKRLDMKKDTMPPGTPAPRSGIYEQIGPRGGRTGEQADSTRGKPLPPTDRAGQGWRLITPAHHRSGK
jgi:hypothetical protein